MPRSKADQDMDSWAAWAQGKGPKPGGPDPGTTATVASAGAGGIGTGKGKRGRGPVPRPGKPQPGTGQPASGDDPLADLKKALEAAGLGGGATEGRRKPYTAKEMADARQQKEQLLKAHLSGPYTQESILGGYDSTVAGILGANHPKAEQFATFAMNQKMDADTFSSWLRARPEYQQTENYRKARGDYLSVLAEVFGYR